MKFRDYLFITEEKPLIRVYLYDKGDNTIEEVALADATSILTDSKFRSLLDLDVLLQGMERLIPAVSSEKNRILFVELEKRIEQ